MHRAIERELGVALAIAHRARLEKVPAAVNERREPDALAAVTCDLVRRDAEEDVVRARCFSSRGVRGGFAMGLDRALRGRDRVLDERRRRRRRRQRGRERRGGGCPRGGAYRVRRHTVDGESGVSRSASIFFFAFFFYEGRRYESTKVQRCSPTCTFVRKYFREYIMLWYSTCTRTRTRTCTVTLYVTYVLYTYSIRIVRRYLRRRLALYTTTHSVVYVYSTRTRRSDYNLNVL
jgi:hypothetical protein